jgi:outer membrane lipase/esterase
VIVFGDSISDGGAYADRAPSGAGSFTTNPDPVWVETIASGLGLTLAPRAAGGTNYAEGGARVTVPRPRAPGDLSRTPVVNQIDAWLGGGGAFQSGDLAIIQGGGNDVFSTQVNGPDFTAADLAVLDQAARDLAGQVRRIAAAGDATIVTVSVPRFEQFNQYYRLTLASVDTNVLYVDVARLVSEIEANPAEFNIQNTTGQACRGRAVESFTCLPSDYVTPDANRTYLFADGVHFTGVVHDIEAGAVLAALRAPRQAGQLPLAAQAALEASQAGLVQAANPAEGRARGWTVFGWMDGVGFDIGASPRASGLEADLAGATVGTLYAVRPGLSIGGALGWSETDGEFSGDTGGFQLRAVTLTTFARVDAGRFNITGQAAVGDLDFDDVERRVALGPAGRTETGNTHGRMWAARAEAGFDTSFGPLTARPLTALRYQRVDVGAYAEAGARSTQISFGDQKLEALLASAGVEVGWKAARIAHPFLRVTYEADLIDNRRTISMTPSGAPVTFTTEAYRPDDRYVGYAAGVTATLRPGLEATAQASGVLGRGGMDTLGFRLGISGRF